MDLLGSALKSPKDQDLGTVLNSNVSRRSGIAVIIPVPGCESESAKWGINKFDNLKDEKFLKHGRLVYRTRFYPEEQIQIKLQNNFLYFFIKQLFLVHFTEKAVIHIRLMNADLDLLLDSVTFLKTKFF